MKKYFFLLLYLSPFCAFGEELLWHWQQREIERYVNVYNNHSSLIIDPSCNLLEHNGLPCRDILKNSCNQFWKIEKGNVSNSAGSFNLGQSDKSKISRTKKIYLEKLVNRARDFPAEIKSILAATRLKLQSHLKNEVDNDDWYGRLDRIENELSQKITLLAEKKAKEKNIDKQEVIYDIKNTITTTIFEGDPDWLRAQKIFTQVREDLLQEISLLNIEPEVKNDLQHAIQETKLLMPTSDSRILGKVNSQNCDSTKVNAVYNLENNIVVVCAGALHGYRTDASTYILLAHELSHAIALDSQAERFSNKSELRKIKEALCGAEGPVFSCDQWEKIELQSISDSQKTFNAANLFQALAGCLQNNTNLMGTDKTEQASAAKAWVDKFFARQARAGNFSHIAEPNQDTFLSAKKIRLKDNNYRCMQDKDISLELFAQNYYCLSKKPNIVNIDIQKNFHEAMEKTRLQQSVFLANWLANCGKECIDNPSYENMADWFASRIFARFLAREPQLQKRKQMAQAAGLVYCDTPESEIESALHSVEHAVVGDPHNADWVRMLSVFTKPTQDLVACKLDDDFSNRILTCTL